MNLFDLHEEAGVSMSVKTSKIMVGTKYDLLNEKLEDLTERVNEIDEQWRAAMEKFNDNEEWHEDFLNRYGKFDKFEKMIDDVVERITNVDQKVLPEYIEATRESLRQYGDAIRKIEEAVVNITTGTGLRESETIVAIQEKLQAFSDSLTKHSESIKVTLAQNRDSISKVNEGLQQVREEVKGIKEVQAEQPKAEPEPEVEQEEQ